jgi:hypothetical protein
VPVKTGGLLSVAQLTVRDVVAVFPHASVAVKVLVCVEIQPLTLTVLLATDIVTTPQLSVPVAVPKALSRSCPTGLHRNKAVPVALIDGGLKSTVHVTVREAVAVLLHPSMIDHDLVCERLHPVLEIGPSVCVTVDVPHASVVVAEPNAASSAAADGLQPGLNVVPLAIRVTVLSKVHVTVLETVVVLLHPSLAVKVLVCDRPQPVLCKRPSVDDIVGVPHASVAVAVPSAASIADGEGLHPNGTGA